MVRHVFFAVVALVAFQIIVAKPKAKPEEKSQIEEVAQNAQQIVQNISHAFGIDEIPDTKKIVEIFNTSAQSLANSVNEAVEKLKHEAKAHQPEIDNVIKSVEQKLNETAIKFQNIAGPEATAKAKEIKASFDQGLKTTVAEIEKLIKSVEPGAAKVRTDVENTAKTLYDQIVQIGTNIQTQVKQTIAEHEKTHKH